MSKHQQQRPQAANPPPARAQGGEDGDPLTAADERALDTAWAAITDEEMEASIKALEERLDQQQQ